MDLISTVSDIVHIVIPQDVADAESPSGEKSVLYLLLKMFLTSSSSHLRNSTQMLVLKVRNISSFPQLLQISGIFFPIN